VDALTIIIAKDGREWIERSMKRIYFSFNIVKQGFRQEEQIPFPQSYGYLELKKNHRIGEVNIPMSLIADYCTAGILRQRARLEELSVWVGGLRNLSGEERDLGEGGRRKTPLPSADRINFVHSSLFHHHDEPVYHPAQ
jgi:hypothetical protein